MITELAPVLEALLLASDKPLSVERLGQVFDEHDGVDNCLLYTSPSPRDS